MWEGMTNRQERKQASELISRLARDVSVFGVRSLTLAPQFWDQLRKAQILCGMCPVESPETLDDHFMIRGIPVYRGNN